SADRTVTQSDNSATFYMINMIPQAPEHNSGLWADMESYSRELAFRGNEVYTIMGVHDKGGTGDTGYREKIAGGRVTVPRYIWKVLVVIPEGVNDLERVNEETRIIAVWTENKNSANSKPWGDYRVSIDDIEAETGLDLLSALPEAIQDLVEARVDQVRIN
ncbi:MAG: DNA/RNA non-specific endonuclease, partial [Saprospiraceae bacterium]|nr:DNA/RNA non-specific endonuclease [Saprospiraceae bacterium]